MKLYIVSCYLNSQIFRIKTYSVDAKETSSSYIFDSDFTKGKRRVSKEKLMMVDTMTRNSINGWDGDSLSFFTYCLESDIEAAKNTVYKAIIEKKQSILDSIGKINTKSLDSPDIVTE